MSCMPQRLPELSLELWTQIFQHLQPQVPQLGDHILSSKAGGGCDSYTFGSLPQVCKEFRGIYSDHPQWYSLLPLPTQLDPTTWEALSYWVSCHKAEVQHIRMLKSQCCSSATNPKTDKSFLLCDVFGKGGFFSAFTALRSCSLDLSAFEDSELNLGVLKSLQHLNGLALEAPRTEIPCICFHLHLLQHLTMLVIKGIDVYPTKNCPFADKLQCLDVHDARFYSLHEAGVAACQQLRQLRCVSSVIAAQADFDSLVTNCEATLIPHTISSLTALECLQIFVAQSPSLLADEELDVQWLTGLTSLTKLVFSSEYAYTLPLDMSRCGKLEDLRFLNPTIPSDMKLCQDWQALSNLRQIHIVGRVGFGTALELLNLAMVRQIKTLSDVYLQVDVDFNGSEQEALEHIKAATEACMQSAPWTNFHIGKPGSNPYLEFEKSLIV